MKHFATMIDEMETKIRSKVAEILSLSHGMTKKQRLSLADKLEGMLGEMKTEVSKSDTAVIGVVGGKKETA